MTEQLNGTEFFFLVYKIMGNSWSVTEWPEFWRQTSVQILACLPAGLSWDKVLSLSELGVLVARQGETHFGVVGRVDVYNVFKAADSS